MRRGYLAASIAALAVGVAGSGYAIEARPGWNNPPDVRAVAFDNRRGKGRDPKPMSQKKRRQRGKWSRKP